MIKILSIITGGWLWHLGGQGFKPARAVIFPAMLGIVKAIYLQNVLALLYFPLLWLMIVGFSYGLSAPPHKFWVWVFGKGESGDYLPVEIATRATCGLFWSLPSVIFAILTGNWIAFSIYMVLSMIGVTLFGLNNDVKVSETGTGASIATSILI